MDHADVDVLFEQVGGETVSERMRRHALGDSRLPRRRMHGAVELAGGHRVDRILAWSPLPCSTRNVMRSLSISDTFRDTTSDTRRPAP